MPTPTASPPADASPDQPVDVAATAAALLDVRTACERDADCLESVVVDPARLFPPGTIDLPSSARTLTLLDDFGDMAVLRVDANGGRSAAQLVVVVRVDEKWLLRDVHDVAQQPG